jgi:hypothetical protein
LIPDTANYLENLDLPLFSPQQKSRRAAWN